MELCNPLTQSLLLKINDTCLARILSLRQNLEYESLHSFWQSRFIERFGVSLGCYAKMSYYDIYRELISKCEGITDNYLELIMKRGYHPLIERLINNNIIDIYTGLKLSIRMGNCEMMKLLLQHPITDLVLIDALHTLLHYLSHSSDDQPKRNGAYEGVDILELFKYLHRKIKSPILTYQYYSLIQKAINNDLYDIVLYFDELSVIDEGLKGEMFVKCFIFTNVGNRWFNLSDRPCSLPLFMYLFTSVKHTLFHHVSNHMFLARGAINLHKDHPSIVYLFTLLSFVIYTRNQEILDYLFEQYPEINQYLILSVIDHLFEEVRFDEPRQQAITQFINKNKHLKQFNPLQMDQY